MHYTTLYYIKLYHTAPTVEGIEHMKIWKCDYVILKESEKAVMVHFKVHNYYSSRRTEENNENNFTKFSASNFRKKYLSNTNNVSDACSLFLWLSNQFSAFSTNLVDSTLL
jgi:hypothetical protein